MLDFITNYPVATAIVAGITLVVLMVGIVVGTIMSED